jgi:AcrR family transcriptional regulator
VFWHDTELEFRLSSDSAINAVMSSPQSSADADHGSTASLVRGLSGAGPADPPARERAERADKARNRARILAAASEAFAERGVEAQMDDVAARAGLGVGTLYRHFATKEALMAALMKRRFEQILEVTRRGIEREDGEPFDVFADVLREGAEVAAADAAAQDALKRVGDAIWSEVMPTQLELLAATQVLIDRAQAAGTMRNDIGAADISMIMCGLSATMSVVEWDWRRYLELALDGLRAGAQSPVEAGTGS